MSSNLHKSDKVDQRQLSKYQGRQEIAAVRARGYFDSTLICIHTKILRSRRMVKRKVIDALKEGKVDVSLSKEIRMRNKVLSLRKVIIWVGSPVGD